MSSTVGCAISIVGNVIVSLSLNIQRLAHKKLGMDDDDSSDEEAMMQDRSMDKAKGNYLKSGWWWAGVLLMACGETGNFLAYAFAPASVVATLGTTGLIANVFFAPLILKERFRKMDLLGVAIAVCGGIIVVLSAQTDQPQLSPDEILVAVSQTSFRVYLLLALSLAAFLTYLSPRYGTQYILIDLGLVALFGAFTALSTKGVSSLLSRLFYNCFKYPIFWILLLVLISTAILQVRYLNRSLANFDSTRVIPCQFCTFTISTIVGSAILYKDFERMDTSTLAQFVSGCLLTFLGVWITSGRSNEQSGSSQTPIQPVSAAQRFRSTISTAFSEQTPLVDELTSVSRPLHKRLHSSNAQTGPLLSYFVAKADNARHRGSFHDSMYSRSPYQSSPLAVPVSSSVSST